MFKSPQYENKLIEIFKAEENDKNEQLNLVQSLIGMMR